MHWPSLRYADWADTCETLHMWTQIVGKIRMAHAPPINHWWHVTLYVTPRGLSTSTMFHPRGAFEIAFDFVDHQLEIRKEGGETASIDLRSMPTSEFYRRVLEAHSALGLPVSIYPMPLEVPDPIRFDRDETHQTYEAEAVERFHAVLLDVDRVLTRFRSSFRGKVSPVHFFWGAADMAVTRFSGREAPKHPGAPGLPDFVTQEAYSHEVSSAGWWPGGNGADAAFYSYAYPEPEGYPSWKVAPSDAFYSKEMREFFLPYEAARNARDPDAAVMAFLESTWNAAAELADWPLSPLAGRGWRKAPGEGT